MPEPSTVPRPGCWKTLLYGKPLYVSCLLPYCLFVCWSLSRSCQFSPELNFSSVCLSWRIFRFSIRLLFAALISAYTIVYTKVICHYFPRQQQAKEWIRTYFTDLDARVLRLRSSVLQHHLRGRHHMAESEVALVCVSLKIFTTSETFVNKASEILILYLSVLWSAKLS